jgi:hypothetical protein
MFSKQFGIELVERESRFKEFCSTQEQYFDSGMRELVTKKF